MKVLLKSVLSKLERRREAALPHLLQVEPPLSGNKGGATPSKQITAGD